MDSIVGRFAKLSFAQKIIGLPVIALVALVAVVGITFQLNSTNRERQASIRYGYYPSVRGSRVLRDNLVALERSYEEAVQEGNGLRLRMADQQSQSFQQTLAELLKNPVADHSALVTIGQDFTNYTRLASETAKRRISGDHGNAVLAAQDSVSEQYTSINRALGDLMQRDDKAIDAAFGETEQLQKSGFIRIVIVGFAAMIVLAGLAVYSVRSLTQPMKEAVRTAEAIAQGDMTVSIGVDRTDEIGQLLKSMQSMVAYLHEMAGVADQIARGDLSRQVNPRSEADRFGHAFANMGGYLRDAAKVAERVAGGDLAVHVEPRSADDQLGRAFGRMSTYLREMAQLGREIADGNVGVRVTPRSDADTFSHAFVGMTETLARTAQSLRGSAGAIAAAATQVAASAQTLSGGTRDETAAVQSTLAHVERMSEMALRTAQHGADLKTMAERDTRNMDEGSGAVRETIAMMRNILARIAVIDEIATETNVLALNASIEAARAGDHGRGFAVVATEVRALSERSRKAAVDIREMASASEKITARSGAILSELSQSMAQTMTIVHDVSAASSDQSAGISEISAAMQQVNSVASQNSSAAEDLAATAQEMSAQAEAMQALVQFFRDSARAAA